LLTTPAFLLGSYISGLEAAVGLLSSSVLFTVLFLTVYWFSNKHRRGYAGTVLETPVHQPEYDDEGVVTKTFLYSI